MIEKTVTVLGVWYDQCANFSFREPSKNFSFRYFSIRFLKRIWINSKNKHILILYIVNKFHF